MPVEIVSNLELEAKDELKVRSTSVTFNVKVSELVVTPSVTVTVKE